MAGTAAVADAVLTTVWQEPVSALRAAHARSGLDDGFATLQARWAVAGQATALSTRRQQTRSAGRLDGEARPGAPLGRLRIDRIGLSTVWVKGTAPGALRKAPGHYGGTALPGQTGTVGIAGHRTTYGAPFRKLDKLEIGDRITLSMPYGAYEYRVVRTRIVSPREAEVLRSTGRDRLVLTACHPLWSAKQRIVVSARLSRRPGGAPQLTDAPRLAATQAGARERARMSGLPRLTAAPRRTF